MDKSFTFRFYDVTRNDAARPALTDVLREIIARPTDQREQQLALSYVVRLENLEDDGANAIVGEILRCQNTNLPSEINRGRRSVLRAERLGHSIVFRFNHRRGILGIQHDNRIVSVGKLLDYASSFNQQAVYSIFPKINQEAWQKFANSGVRKLSIRIASPENLVDLNGRSRSVGSGFKAMGEAYNAPHIGIELSMGHHAGVLANTVHGLARQLSRMTQGAQLEKLSAVVEIDDAREEIDLIQDRVVKRADLEIHDRDPEVNWRIKRDYLCGAMRELYG